jgi:hypothetical protein
MAPSANSNKTHLIHTLRIAEKSKETLPVFQAPNSTDFPLAKLFDWVE